MADAVELIIALTAKDAASGVLGNLSGKFAGLGSAGKLAVAGIAAGATAIAGTIGALTALAQKSAVAAGEVSKLKRETGLTTEAASKFRAIGERMGLSVDDLSKSFGIFSKNLDNNAKAISDNHVQIVKTKDGQVDLEKTLGTLAERFKTMPDGVAKTSLAMEIFGKSGKDMLPLLNQGKDGLKALGDEAARLGLVFDDKALAAAKRYSLAQKDLGENIEGLKNRIGTAFLPILADASQAMLAIATAVLPYLSAGFDRLSGFVRTAVGVVQDMVKAWRGDMAGGGDLLASIIGPQGALSFMETVRNVALTFNHFWETVVKPAFTWAQDNIPGIWENVKNAISNAWAIIKPHLEEFLANMKDLKEKFDALPAPFRDAMTKIAVSAVIAKQTGLDDWISNISNSIQGAGGLLQVLDKMKGKWVDFATAVATKGLIIADIALVATAIELVAENVMLISDNWENLRKAVHEGSLKNVNAVEDFLSRLVTWGDMFDKLGTHTQNTMAAWTKGWNDLSDVAHVVVASIVLTAQTAWRNILVAFEGMVNGAIDSLNELIKGLNNLPGGGGIPLISKITIELPNTSWAEGELDRIARRRTAPIFANVYEQAIAGGGGSRIFAEGTPFVDYTGPAIVHRGEAIIPANQNPWAGGGAVGGILITGNTFNVRTDDDIQKIAQALDDLARSTGRRIGTRQAALA